MLIYINLGFHVAELSGLITVGIGDSFASIIGTKYGAHRYLGSKKSLEGTLALALSQIVTFILLHAFHLFNMFDANNLLFVLTSVILSSFTEAFTNDNDNFVLPMVVYPFLRLIK